LLCLNIAIARALGASESSTIFYLSNLFSLLVLIGGMSLENAFIYYTSNKTIATAKMIWFGLVWIICISLLTGAVAFIYFHFVEPIKLFQRDIIVLWAVIFTAGTLFINFYSGLFYATGDFKTPNIITAILNLLLAVIISLSVYFVTDTDILLSRYFYLFLIQGIIVFLVFILTKKQYWQPQLPSSKENTMLLHYATKALVANIVFFLVYRVDYWLIINKCSAADAGNYMQASRFAQLLWLIPQMLATAVFPRTAEGINETEIRNVIMRFARVFILIYVLISVLLVVAGNLLFTHLLGGSFNKVSVLMLLLMPGVIALSILCLLSAYFAGINKVAVNVKGAFAGLAAVIILSSLAWHYYTIYVAALISSVSYCVCFIYAFSIFSKQHKIVFKKLMIFSKADWQFIINFITNKS
jgi:O-antigen/teichoic acid export membrane protein